MAVRHARFGRGEVVKSRYAGLETLVRFDDGIERWIRSVDLSDGKVAGTGRGAKSTLRLPGGRSGDGRKDFDARRMIEAFRLGIVPYDLVDKFTVGREDELGEFTSWLEARSSSLVLVGEYGAGKTHLLQYVVGKALGDGWAVALVQMDSDESPFHHPKRVYRQIVKTLRFGDPSSPGTFRDFLGESLRRGKLADHRYFRHVPAQNADEPYWEWIEGREASVRPWAWDSWRYEGLPALYDYSTAGNIYCYLLSGLGWAAINALGLKGLLILFDEAESVDSFWYSYQLERSDDFLRALIGTASNRSVLLELPVHSGMTFCRVGAARRTPFLYRRTSGLKLLFAFTPTYGLDRIPELRTARRLELDALDEASLKEVFRGLCRLYRHAYPEANTTEAQLFTRVADYADGASGTRLFMKAAVEALDLDRFA